MFLNQKGVTDHVRKLDAVRRRLSLWLGAGLLVGSAVAVLTPGCSVSGNVPTFRESLGLPDYGKPPGFRVSKGLFGVKMEVSSEALAKLKSLDYEPATSHVKLEDLELSTTAVNAIKAIGDTATANADKYDVNVTAKLKEIEMKEETKREVAIAGIQAGAQLGQTIAPFLNASPAAQSASRPGLLAGMLSQGIEPSQLAALAAQLMEHGPTSNPTPLMLPRGPP